LQRERRAYFVGHLTSANLFCVAASSSSEAAEKPKEASSDPSGLIWKSTEIYCGSKALKLQPRQHDLLSALLLYGNRVCPREYLASSIQAGEIESNRQRIGS